MNGRNPLDLERQLRDAMRPVDPPSGFSERVLAGLARSRERSGTGPVSAFRGTASPWRRRRLWLPDAAVAAFAAVLIGTGIWSQQRTLEVRAREARTEVFEALRISSQALNAALHATVEPGRSG